MPKTNQNDQDENWNEGYGHLGGRGWREGLDDAMHHGQGPHAGRGPRNFRRSDSNIEEDINERLTEHSWIDATDVEVSVETGEVTLRGRVDNHEAKELAETISGSVFGVRSVNNQIRVKQSEQEGSRRKAG